MLVSAPPADISCTQPFNIHRLQTNYFRCRYVGVRAADKLIGLLCRKSVSVPASSIVRCRPRASRRQIIIRQHRAYFVVDSSTSVIFFLPVAKTVSRRQIILSEFAAV